MGEKITEAQATDLLALLRTDASVDTKVAQIDNVKSGIKKNNVPDACVSSLFEITRIAMTSQHAALVNAGFSTLNHLLTRLSRQEPKHVTKEVGRTLPLVVEKLGDHKEKYRLLATQCLTTFWKASPMDVERAVRNSAMTGKNSRAKETSMHWIVQVFCYSLSLLSITGSLTRHHIRCIRKTAFNSEASYQH
jgi:CLIP-associating protein 1/2